MEVGDRFRQAIEGREQSLAACSEAETIKDGQYQWRRALIWHQLAMSFVSERARTGGLDIAGSRSPALGMPVGARGK